MSSNQVVLTDELLHEALRVDPVVVPIELRVAVREAVAAAPRRRPSLRRSLMPTLHPAWLLVLLALLVATMASLAIAGGLLELRRGDTTLPTVTAPPLDPDWASGGLTWSRGQELRAAEGLSVQIAGAHDGVLYAITGNQITSYDPRSDTWADVGAIPEGTDWRYMADPVVGADGALYLFGAESELLEESAESARVVIVRAADGSSTTRVEPIAPWMPAASGHHVHAKATTGSDGRIYLHPWSEAATTAPALDIYDPATDSWTRSARMPSRMRQAPVAADANGKIWVLGDAAVQGRDVTAAQIYDPLTDTWSTPALDLGGVDGPAVAGPDGAMYIADGFTSQGSVVRVDEVTGESREVGPMPMKGDRSAAGAYRIDDRLIFVAFVSDGTRADSGLEPYVLAPSVED